MDYLYWLYAKIVGSEANSSCAIDDETCAYTIPRKVVAFGNVLLDRSVQLESLEVLERYKITPGSKGELPAKTLAALRAELAECTKSYTNPGGAALNTVRILKQLGTHAIFFGAVGVDAAADELRDILRERGVEARLQTIGNAHTGQCIALVHEGSATLYANIGASARFSTAYLQHVASSDAQSFLRPIERKQILYIEGFFVPAREAVCDYIVTHYIRERRRLALNLSAPYIVQQNCAQMLKLAHSAFFIFGNQLEYEALRRQMQCASTEEMAMQLLQNGATTKIIVITKGADGAQIITNFVDEQTSAGGSSEISFESYMAPRVAQIVDVTGAGDAFVAGFLHAWLAKRSLSECVRLANDIAAKVVTQLGCNLPTNGA